MLVDTASASRAEDLVSELRRTLGSLPVRPLSVNQAPSEIMTRWLQGQDLPKDLTLADQCELRDPDAEGGIVRCRRQDLAADEIQAHLKAGKRAVQVALEWEERVGVLLTDQPAFKRLRFGDFLLEQAAETGGDDPRARFDADFTLMTLELRRFIDRMLEVLGGASGE
jgi:recombination associated protein RdgC